MGEGVVPEHPPRRAGVDGPAPRMSAVQDKVAPRQGGWGGADIWSWTEEQSLQYGILRGFFFIKTIIKIVA